MPVNLALRSFHRNKGWDEERIHVFEWQRQAPLLSTLPPLICARSIIYQSNVEREQRMCLLHIHAQSQGRTFEVLPDEVENTELMAEDAVSQVMLDLFDEAIVDEVTVHFSPASHTGQRNCSIQIQVQCSYQSFKLLPCTKQYMELAIGKSMSSALKELFGPVTIESVIVQRLLRVS